jgi:phosphoribosylanthranilate isomerase
MKLKICGMKYPENISEVSKLLPDYMGFIFWKNSSRFCDIELPQLPEHIMKIGVFVDASLAEIEATIKRHGLQGIQLHGNESPEFCRKCKAFKLIIIKAFAIDAAFDFSILKSYESVSDYYLFDTKGELPGGNGQTFEWKVLAKNPSNKPFFLSGGIGLEEMEAIKNLNLPIHAIDVNSKFETAPGLKNTEDLRLFQNLLNQCVFLK